MAAYGYLELTYIMISAPFWDTTPRGVAGLYRRFGKTYRFHPKWSRIPRRKDFFDFLKVEDGTDMLCRNVGTEPQLNAV
jgi:hypothetical protein